MTSHTDDPTTSAPPGDPASEEPVPHELLHGHAYMPEHDPGSGGVDKVVFGVSAALTLAFVAWGLIDTAGLGAASDSALQAVMTGAGWAYVLLATFFVVFVLWLAASRFGDITLGADNEKPEFRTSSWIAMMFSAGMGIGLMFFGAAEPLSHYVTPPPRTGVQPQSP